MVVRNQWGGSDSECPFVPAHPPCPLRSPYTHTPLPCLAHCEDVPQPATWPGHYLPSSLPVSGACPRSDFLCCLCEEFLPTVHMQPPLSHACVF